MIDTHVHLYLSETPVDLLLDNAKRAGVEAMICVSLDLTTAEQCLTLSKEHESVFPTVGIHPLSSDAFGQLSQVSELITTHQDFVAVGEIGLDYKYGTDNRLDQIRVFEAQLEIARQHHYPVIIHHRQAEEDMVRILAEYPDIPTVVHCFTGGPELVERLNRPNLFFSFTGMITYSEKGKMIRAIRDLPLDKIMIETDMPYLTPLAQKGQKNEPAFVVEIAKKIAQIKGVPIEKVMTSTTETAKVFFGI